jgi:hypothetical protein
MSHRTGNHTKTPDQRHNPAPRRRTPNTHRGTACHNFDTNQSVPNDRRPTPLRRQNGNKPGPVCVHRYVPVGHTNGAPHKPVSMVDINYLAEKWVVSKHKARSYTRTPDFPAAFAPSPRVRRWRLEEVEVWEATRTEANLEEVPARRRWDRHQVETATFGPRTVKGA